MFDEKTKRHFRKIETGNIEDDIVISNESPLIDLKLDFKKLCRAKKCNSITEYVNMLEKKCFHN